MTFDEWWKEYKDRISTDCEIALTETLKGFFRLCFADGMVRGEQYLKDKIRPKLAELDRTVAGWLSLQPETPDELNEEVEAEKRKQRKQKKVEEQTPVQEYKQGDKVQVFVEKLQQWIDGEVAQPASTLRGHKEVLVWITRLDGGTDEQGSRDESRNFPFQCVRKVW